MKATPSQPSPTGEGWDGVKPQNHSLTNTPMKTTKVSFTNTQGEKLGARLEMPVDSYPHNFAIFAHCFTCNKNLIAVRNIARALTQSGFAVLRFDFTGLGESEGDFSDTNFSSNVEDLVAAANFLSEEYQAPSLLIGHSLGGAAVLMARQHISTVKAVATIGAPYAPAHVSHLFESKKEEIEAEGKARVSIAGRRFTIKKQFIDDLESLSSFAAIKSLDASLLVMHSPIDEIVEVDNATQIYKAASHPRSFISLDDADHLLSEGNDSLYVGEVIATWAKRYLPIPQKDPLDSEEQAVVRLSGKEFTTEVKTGNHFLIADEPLSVGGNDFGPTPYDLLVSALGACTAMTIRMYASRKKWDLEEVRVHLSHEKVHSTDAGGDSNKKNQIDQITRIVELEGNLDDKQKARLLEIANKCPVHRTLHNEVVVETTLGDNE